MLSLPNQLIIPYILVNYFNNKGNDGPTTISTKECLQMEGHCDEENGDDMVLMRCCMVVSE